MTGILSPHCRAILYPQVDCSAPSMLSNMCVYLFGVLYSLFTWFNVSLGPLFLAFIWFFRAVLVLIQLHFEVFWQLWGYLVLFWMVFCGFMHIWGFLVLLLGCLVSLWGHCLPLWWFNGLFGVVCVSVFCAFLRFLCVPLPFSGSERFSVSFGLFYASLEFFCVLLSLLITFWMFLCIFRVVLCISVASCTS